MDSDRAQIEREIRQQIVHRARVNLGFKWHAVVFVMANAAMIAINLRFNRSSSFVLMVTVAAMPPGVARRRHLYLGQRRHY